MATLNGTTNTNNTDEKKMLRLVWEEETFTWNKFSGRSTTGTLATMIKRKFQESLHDCIGCYIDPYVLNNGMVKYNLKLYFADNQAAIPAGKIKNVVDNTTFTSSSNRHNTYEMKKNIDSRYNGKRYTINDDTKEILSDFMYGGRNVKNRKWEQLITCTDEYATISSPYMMNKEAKRTIVCVTGFDINVVIRNLFGKKIEVVKSINGEEKKMMVDAYYDIEYVGPMPNDPISHIVNVSVFDKQAIEEIFRAEHPQFVQYQNGIVMY